METTRPTRLSPSEKRGLVALAMAMLIGSLGVSVATVALPALARDFSVPVAQLQWVVLAYLLSVTVTVVAGGRLGDLAGNRPVLLAGLGVFSLASAACALAPSPGALIAARAAQGIGGAILMALPVSIIRDTVPKERTGAAMGLMGTMSAIGTALGPSLGGLIIAWSGWRAAFLLLTVAGVAVFALAAREVRLPQNARLATWRSLDLPGTVVLALALAAYSLSITGASSGLTAGGGLLLLAAAAGFAAFIAIERRREMPLVQLGLLRERLISASLFMNLLISSVMMSTLVVGPLYLAFALDLDDALVGIVMAVGPATAALSGIPAGRLTDRFGARRMLLAGLLQTIAGLVCFALVPGYVGVIGYVLALMLLTPGFQLFLAANNTSLMLAAPEAQRGMVAGLLGLSRNLGFMTGAAAMGALFSLRAGSPDIAQASPGAVGAAFSATFVVAAGLAVLAVLVALIGCRTSASGEEHAEPRYTR